MSGMLFDITGEDYMHFKECWLFPHKQTSQLSELQVIFQKDTGKDGHPILHRRHRRSETSPSYRRAQIKLNCVLWWLKCRCHLSAFANKSSPPPFSFSILPLSLAEPLFILLFILGENCLLATIFQLPHWHFPLFLPLSPLVGMMQN